MERAAPPQAASPAAPSVRPEARAPAAPPPAAQAAPQQHEGNKGKGRGEDKKERGKGKDRGASGRAEGGEGDAPPLDYDGKVHFEIPEAMQQRFGYPALTREIKEQILSTNAQRLYGITADVVTNRSWVTNAAADLEHAIARTT